MSYSIASGRIYTAGRPTIREKNQQHIRAQLLPNF
jgi:hypothetical protein